MELFSFQTSLEEVLTQPEFIATTGVKLSGPLYCDGAEDKPACIQVDFHTKRLFHFMINAMVPKSVKPC